MANIQKLWTSYVDLGNTGNQTTPYNYIGQEGRLWYDNVDNVIRVSDGNTPGGTIVGSGGGGGGSPASPNAAVQFNNQNNFGGDANFTFNAGTNTLTVDYIISNITSNTFISNTANLGNFTISDQTLAGTITDRDVTFTTVGNGNIDILASFNIHTDGNAANTAQFSVTGGEVTMLVPNVGLQGAVNIIGSADGAEVSPQNNGVMLHITGQATIPSRIYNDAVANYGAVINRRYNGTSSSPTGVLANQILGRLGATPFLSNNAFTPISTTRIDFVATEIQTPTNQGSKISLYTVPDGSNVITLNAEFSPEGILLTGNITPTVDNFYSLGNSTLRWKGAHFGNGGIFIQDVVSGGDGQLSLNNGVFLFDNQANTVQISHMQLYTNGIKSANTASNIQIGTTSDTGYTSLKNLGLVFRDGTIQTTAAIPLTQKGAASGVVPLNSSTKIDPIYLPAGAINYLGTWNATTNTPTLADGTGSAGDQYLVAVGGTQNLGSGSITFDVGDGVLYNGTIWQRVAGLGAGVTSFNTRTGAVTLTSGDVTNALSAGSIINSKLANPNLTISTGSGLSGGGVIALGGSLTLTATGVVSLTGGTGVTVGNTGTAYTVSIGQPVGTANSVQFAGIVSSTTIQATGNITGANLSTTGQVVATGNIVTSAYLKTPNTTINNGITSNGTINFTTSPNVSLGSNANVHITGGSSGYVMQTDGSGNLSWTNFGTPGQSLYLGAFYSSLTQTNPIANVARQMTFDGAESFNNGITIVSNSRITIANNGIYNIQFSAQIDKTDSGTDDIDIWLSKNNVNLAYTNTQLTLQPQSAKQVAAWNWIVQATAGDYFEINWSSIDTGMRLLAVGTQIDPARPAVPSVILSVTQA